MVGDFEAVQISLYVTRANIKLSVFKVVYRIQT